MHEFKPNPHNFTFNGCSTCEDCCSGKKFLIAPLILEDFVLVKDYFPILFGYIDYNLKCFILFSNGDSACPYLINNICSIYSNRPPACKTYPLSPFNDQVLCDTSCPAVQYKSDFPFGIPFIENNKINQSFHPTRFDNFVSKYKKTKKWLDSIEDKLVYLNAELQGIKLFKLDPNLHSDEYSNLHFNSLKNLKLFPFVGDCK